MWFSLFDVAGPGDVEDLQPAHKHRKPEANEEQIESDGKQKFIKKNLNLSFLLHKSINCILTRNP